MYSTGASALIVLSFVSAIFIALVVALECLAGNALVAQHGYTVNLNLPWSEIHVQIDIPEKLV